MRILLNELSFVGQANSIHDASTLMRTAGDVIKVLEPFQGDDPLYTHSSLFSCQLSPDCNVHECVLAGLQSMRDKDLWRRFIVVVKKGPFIDRILDEELDYCECWFNQRDLPMSSIAGAAYFSGVLVSLKGAPGFEPDRIQVRFSTDGELYREIEIRNFVDPRQARGLRRQYVPSPKHAPGGWGTLMDLDDDVAQRVLDNGIPSGKQVYGYYERSFYVFQSDNTGGHHGYPVHELDVPTNVLRQMRDSGIC